MKINFHPKKPDFYNYIIVLIEELGFTYKYEPPSTLRISGKNNSIELYCEGTTLKFYHLNDLIQLDDPILDCGELDLTNPESFDIIKTWLNKLR